jgi:pimeloyl-ACP methyl ester carboxylesterase
MRERNVTVQGLAICLCEWGPATGKPVLCVHGTRDHGASWEAVATTLVAQGYHVIAPDLRGHGRSDHVAPYSQYQLRDFVSDLAQIAEALGKQPVTLVGHSLGAIIAVLYSAAYPASVERLVLVEPPLSPMPEAEQSFAQQMALGLKAVEAVRHHTAMPDLQAAAERLRQVTPTLPASVALRRAERLTQAQGDGVVWRWDARFDGQAQLDALFAGLRKAEYLALLAAIQTPVTVAYGAASGWISPAEKARIQQARPLSTPVVLPGGHNLHLDAPTALAQVILHLSTDRGSEGSNHLP